MKITARLKGVDKLDKELEILAPKIEGLIFDELVKKGLAIQGDAIKGISKISGGERVIRYSPKRTHLASKEGDPPNTDTGRLIGSIRIQMDRASQSVSVGSNVKYAPHLEFGTKHMGKRPWLGPAFKKNRKFKKPKVKKRG